MMNEHFPFVSVVIATFNRSKFIGACLESVARQTYPKDCYEIIVVDDGSTDNTVRIAEAYGIRVIEHKNNRGPSAARNTGIMAAKGEIVAFIDDDAVADPEWLGHLVQPFDSPEVAASGGQTFALKTDRIAERYLSAVGYGNPAPLAFGKSKNPILRFFVYLKDMFVPVIVSKKSTEVQAVYTCNCAYRASALQDVGGFDETLLADEDTDLSTRIRNVGAHIIFIPNATVKHHHRESLAILIYQTYRRAKYTVHYYAKEHKTLPIFPLPLIYIVSVIPLFIFQPIAAISFIILGPLLLYVWWPIKAFRVHYFEYFVYGYIQLILELTAILGMAREKCRILIPKIS